MPETAEFVVAVDEADIPLGRVEKLEAHRDGVLHRAFSVMLRNRQGQLLLQRRSPGKYHSGGLWANSCCGHPRPGEEVGQAAARRLGEELGVACALSGLGTFRYRAEVGGGLVENELVHLFRGEFDGPCRPDPAEVAEFRWVSRQELLADLARGGQGYTAWFLRYAAEAPHFLV